MNVNKIILEFLKNNNGYLVIYIIFMLAYPLSSVFLPKYYGQIVEDLKSQKHPRFTITLILLLIVNAMYIILDKVDVIFIPKLQAHIRMNIVKVVLQNYKDKFEEQELGKIISKIVKFPIVVRDMVWQIRNHIVPLIFIIFMVIIQFFMIDKRIGITTITIFFILFSITIPMFIKSLDISSDMDNETDVIHEDISELFDNLIDIYSMNTANKEIEYLEKRQEDIINRYENTFGSTNKLRIWMNTLSISLFLSMIVYSYNLYSRKEIVLGDMINIAVSTMYIINKIGSFSGEIPDLVFNLGVYSRTQKYLENLDMGNDKTDNFIIGKGEVIFRDVTLRYTNKIVLKNFNLMIEPGESITIFGKIGSGKSSLVKALLKLISYEGHIYIDGRDISELQTSTIRSQILYVRQNPIPFNRTLYENIIYGNENINKKQVLLLFDKYNLYSFFNHDLDDNVGKKGGKLSGGQRQMIFLLRVLLSKNPIIILDEPTSSLDNTSSKYVMKLLEDIIKSRTVIIITHDEKISKITRRKIELY